MTQRSLEDLNSYARKELKPKKLRIASLQTLQRDFYSLEVLLYT